MSHVTHERGQVQPDHKPVLRGRLPVGLSQAPHPAAQPRDQRHAGDDVQDREAPHEAYPFLGPDEQDGQVDQQTYVGQTNSLDVDALVCLVETGGSTAKHVPLRRIALGHATTVTPCLPEASGARKQTPFLE